MSKIILNKWSVFLIILIILGIGSFYLLERGQKIIEIENTAELPKEAIFEEASEHFEKSTISGLPCQNYNRRPIAVVLAEDSIARPLSGISQADLVMEMPVITGGITRMVAIFQCEEPGEIGSLRSARHDFIPLAMGLDAILVHWGGSHYALDMLAKKTMDNIDALTNPNQAFWRKETIPPPHNGFTSMENILKVADNRGYRKISNFEGYPHITEIQNSRPTSPASELAGGQAKSEIRNEKDILDISYPYPYNIKYEYNPETNYYLRWRGGRPEIDKLTGKQVEVKNIVIMKVFSRQLEQEYNDLDVEGEGITLVYRNGEEINGTWKKNKASLSSKLYFFDKTGKEIEFVPGPIWIEMVEPYQQVNWK